MVIIDKVYNRYNHDKILCENIFYYTVYYLNMRVTVYIRLLL